MLGGPLERLTVHTITDADRLRALLAGVRRTGSVVLPGHIHEEAAGVAVPVRDARGAVVPAVPVIVPNDARAHEKVPLLQAAALGIRRAQATPDMRSTDRSILTG